MVFYVNYVGKDSSKTIYLAFRDPAQIPKIRDCSENSGTVGAYEIVFIKNNISSLEEVAISKHKQVHSRCYIVTTMKIPVAMLSLRGNKITSQ